MLIDEEALARERVRRPRRLPASAIPAPSTDDGTLTNRDVRRLLQLCHNATELIEQKQAIIDEQAVRIARLEATDRRHSEGWLGHA